MGLFKKLFTADPVALRKKADSLFETEEFGSAKLAYEKARDASPDVDDGRIESRIRECMDNIARLRVKQARAYVAEGALELAAHELDGALEVAATDAVRNEAQQLRDGLEADDAREQAVSEEITDEERLALIAGHWQDGQADEYEEYGQPLFDALVAMQSERFEEAQEGIERVFESAQEPRYLWLELGRIRLVTEDLEGAKDALERFLAELRADEGGETKLAAHLALARLADDAGDFEGAMAHFETCVAAMPDDYRPYLAMGAFLRRSGHQEEAVEVLETALALSKNAGFDWRLFEEAGLACDAAGKTEEAQKFLGQVTEFFTQRHETDFPPATATTLARLYENAGNLDRAADMYRALSEGSDRDHHAEYHYEAGRLLQALGLDEEARRMLTRAHALSEDDGELTSKITALLQE